MLAAVIATFLTSLVFGHSFFDEQLLRRGIDLSRGRGDLELQSQPISSVVNCNFVAVEPDLNVKEAINKLVKAQASEGYCLGHKKNFVGKFALQELLVVPSSSKIQDSLMKQPIFLNHDASVLQAMEVASNFVGESIPVISRSDGKLAGVVTEADIFQAYMSTQVKINDLERS